MTSEAMAAAGLLAALLLASCARSPGDVEAPGGDLEAPQAGVEEWQADVEAIRAVMDRQVAAWNDGDVRAFMEGYAQTDTLRFASGGQVHYGWERTLQRYREAYANRDQMGTLAFSGLDIWPLSPGHALVFGRWDLERVGAYSDIGGLFTLVFERGDAGWRIVHDHTSSAPADESSQQQSD